MIWTRKGSDPFAFTNGTKPFVEFSSKGRKIKIEVDGIKLPKCHEDKHKH